MVAANSMFPDRGVQIWYWDETAFGVKEAATNKELGKVISYNDNFTDELQRLHGLGEGRNETSVIHGNVNITANLEWQPLGNFASARSSTLDFLKYAVGGITGVGSDADPYDIVESENYGYTAASDILTFQLEVAMEGVAVGAGTATDDTTLLTGCIMPSATISAAVGGMLTASANITAQNLSCDASDVESFTPETGTPFAYQQGSWAFDASPPSTVSHVQNWSITTANNPIIYREIGSRFIQTPVTGQRKWDWSTTMIMSSEEAINMRNDFLKDDSTPFVFDAATTEDFVTADLEILGRFTEGSSSNDLSISFLLDQAYIMNMTKSVSVGGGLVQVTFTGGAKSAKTNFIQYDKKT